jgi:hypothetical protein
VGRAAVVLYCTPAYVIGLGVLLLFHPTFGTLPLPYFFDAAPIRASPLSSPWEWFRSLLVPWLVAAAPLAAMCLRLVVALLREQQDTDHVRTAFVKGVPHKRVIRHHAGPFARAATASLVGVSAPIVVLNLCLHANLTLARDDSRASGQPGCSLRAKAPGWVTAAPGPDSVAAAGGARSGPIPRRQGHAVRRSASRRAARR